MSGLSVRVRKKWVDSPHLDPNLFYSGNTNQSDSTESADDIKTDKLKKKRGRKRIYANQDFDQIDPNDTKENLDIKEKKNRTKKKAQIVEEILLKEADVEEKDKVPKKKRGRKKKYVLAPSESDESLAPPANSPKLNKRITRQQKQQNDISNASAVEEVETSKKSRKKKYAQPEIKKADEEMTDIDNTFDLNVNGKDWTPALKENMFNINANACTGSLDRRSTFDIGIKKLPGTACEMNFEEDCAESSFSRKSRSSEKTPFTDKKSSRKTVEFSAQSSSKSEKSSRKTVTVNTVNQKSCRKTSGDNLKRLGTRKSVRFTVSTSPKLKKSNSFPTVKTPSKILSPRKGLKREGTFELSPEKSLLRRSLNMSGVLSLNTSAVQTNKIVDLTTPSTTPNIPRKSYKKTPAKLPSININNDSNTSLLQNSTIPFNDTTFDKSSKLNIDDVSPISKNKGETDEKSPASCTSTPFCKSEKKLLKKVLSKEDSFKSKRTKMPNFAKIHQKAYDKLENIQELSQRKAERAKLLLSGHKPEANLNKSRNTPIAASKKLFNISNTNKVTPAVPKLNPQIKKLTPIEKMKIKAAAKPIDKVHTTKVGYTRFGFKLPREADQDKQLKKEQIQAVANKSKPKRSIENRRFEIKGVRSNRRFELLMAMRKLKN